MKSFVQLEKQVAQPCLIDKEHYYLLIHLSFTDDRLPLALNPNRNERLR